MTEFSNTSAVFFIVSKAKNSATLASVIPLRNNTGVFEYSGNSLYILLE